MTKRVLQVYILCCGKNIPEGFIRPQQKFHVCFCQDTTNAKIGFELALGRMPKACEVRPADEKALLSEITMLPENVEHVLIAASSDMARALAGQALEIPLEAAPLSIDHFHYAHLQWGNKRCPGKWFMQRWNISNLPKE